jgi:hypothetical protein
LPSFSVSDARIFPTQVIVAVAKNRFLSVLGPLGPIHTIIGQRRARVPTAVAPSKTFPTSYGGDCWVGRRKMTQFQTKAAQISSIWKLPWISQQDSRLQWLD